MNQTQRSKRIRRYFGDLLKINSNKEAKELWNRLMSEKQERDNAEKKAQKEIDIAVRQSKTPSRKHKGKHDIRQDS